MKAIFNIFIINEIVEAEFEFAEIIIKQILEKLKPIFLFLTMPDEM